MQSQIFVTLDDGVELELDSHELPAMSREEARAWLDAQFISLDCEPLRASGKVLNADKVLRVTQAGGAAMFADPKWVTDYRRAVLATLGRPLIRVDVPAMAITY